jgi:hypothetical protein
MNVLTAFSTMKIETKFLRLKTPVTIGSFFGDWRVTWLGGWTRHKLSYLVMIARVAPKRLNGATPPDRSPEAVSRVLPPSMASSAADSVPPAGSGPRGD